MPKNVFIGLDFETMTAERTSACAVGLVTVVDGVIVNKFYSLIRPIPDDRKSTNAHVHGITPEMVANAPTFEELYPQLSLFLNGRVVVCHNKAFDLDVLSKCAAHYSLPAFSIFDSHCTFEKTGLPLDDACALNRIKMAAHHNALSDAQACAELWQVLQGGKIVSAQPTGARPPKAGDKERRKYEKATLVQLEDDAIADKTSPFFNAKVVVTGVFGAYPQRNDLGKVLQSLGADVNTSISKKTNIVVVGTGAGPAKLKKIDSLRDEGYDIRIIEEEELLEILKEHGIG